MERKIRVACFIDGFNLYHAISELGSGHLKWVDLTGLMGEFIQEQTQEIVQVSYFTALASHYPQSARRHQVYINALESQGTKCVLGEFKRKHKTCPLCRSKFQGHEEKQTDTNIALGIVEGAYNNRYDEAFVVTGDSDMAPALGMVKAMNKQRKIKLIAPPGRRHSKELGTFADKLVKIKPVHLERNLLPREVLDSTGKLISTRPVEYDPPI